MLKSGLKANEDELWAPGTVPLHLLGTVVPYGNRYKALAPNGKVFVIEYGMSEPYNACFGLVKGTTFVGYNGVIEQRPTRGAIRKAYFNWRYRHQNLDTILQLAGFFGILYFVIEVL